MLALFKFGGWTHCGSCGCGSRRFCAITFALAKDLDLQFRSVATSASPSQLHSCTSVITSQYMHRAGIEHRMMNVSQGVRACAAASTEREEPQSVPWTGSLPAFPPSRLPSLQMLQRGLGHMLPSLQDSAQQKASSFGHCLAAAAKCKDTSLAISDPKTAVASCRATRWSHSPFVADAPGDRQHYAQLLC